jgi:5-methylcytosine-specific restriction endonuclease McrA
MSKSSEAVKRWRANTKNKMVKAMGNKCQGCGYSLCNDALAFHHINPLEKETGFGDLRADPKKWDNIVSELKKCILVCHNCHSEIHAGIRELPESYSTFDESFIVYDKNVKEENNCICGKLKFSAAKFCSRSCASKNHRKVDWDNIDLLELMKNNTIGQLEDMLGVSNAAIYKRRDKILGK